MTQGCARRHRHRPRIPGPICFGLWVGLSVALAGCGVGGGDLSIRPDSVLQAELGLSPRDEVHRVTIQGGEGEVLTPPEVLIPEGAWVQFVTGDWRVHEIRFEVDSLSAEGRRFLEESDQIASPPMVDLGDRFVVSFVGAPDGRYPFIAEGNGAPQRGVVVVGSKR